MGHAAVTTPDAHFVTERLARGGIGQAGVQADPFEAWIDDWQLVGPDFATLTMTASGPDFAYDMVLNSDGPLVFHGDEGYSVKSAEGQASFYYSQPFYAIEGTIILPTGSIEVAGDAWLDREWSSQPLSNNQTGWDWFSLSLEDGKLMGFRLRQTDGSYYTSATWIDPNGSATSYSNGAFEADPVAISDVGGRDVPTTWNVRLPDRMVDVEVTAINPQAWMDTSVPYWEGPIIVLGSHTGRGYLEMTGYD
jgi:predicted secreted hydrolase